MKLSRRTAWLLLLLGVGLSLGIIFRAFLVENVVVPIATLLSLFWRVLISVHQAIYWGAVIALAAVLVVRRLYQMAGHEEEQYVPASDSILSAIESRRRLLQASGEAGYASVTLKRDLRRMLVGVYAAKQPEAVPFVIEDALRLRQLPLPDRIYGFLFDEEAQGKEPGWRQRLLQFAATPERWRRHWTGIDKVEFHQALEETLAYMETLMEVKHGNDDFNPSGD